MLPYATIKAHFSVTLSFTKNLKKKLDFGFYASEVCGVFVKCVNCV